MLKKWLLALGLTLSLAANAAIKEGVDYVKLPNPQAVSDKTKVEVLEFFSYGCIHCLNLDLPLDAWAKKNLAIATVRKEHVVWGKNMEPLAKLHTAILLEPKKEQVATAAFDAVVNKKVNLSDPAVVATWIKTQPGVNAAAFMKNFNSFAASTYVAKATKITKDYNVQGTPMVVVGGKYAINPATPERLLQVLDELVVLVRSEKK